jgi:exodeoxyribonuclease V beta subunit
LAQESQEQEDLSAINFGLALHYMLEMMSDFTPEAIANAKDMLLNKYGFALEEKEIDEIVLRVNRLISDELFLALLENGTYYKERALRYKNNLRYLDLLIEKEDGSYIIVDYKSGMNFHDKHLTQVRYYMKAVRAITGAEVKGYLCYLLEDGTKLVQV